jgi:hypothetical protein
MGKENYFKSAINKKTNQDILEKNDNFKNSKRNKNE